MIERVFLKEELYQDKVVSRNDLDAMEKEISIDVAELRRDLRNMSSEINTKLSMITETMIQEQPNHEGTPSKVDREKSIIVNRNSSRHRKKSVLNEASYLAHRLSRALSHAKIPTDDENQEEDKEENNSKYLPRNKNGEGSGMQHSIT